MRIFSPQIAKKWQKLKIWEICNMRLWKMVFPSSLPIFSPKNQFGIKFFQFSSFARRSRRTRIWLCLAHEPIKARGGGSRPKFWFCVILVANLVYFHTLFTEFENFDPLAQNSRICRGGWGLLEYWFYGNLAKSSQVSKFSICFWMFWRTLISYIMKIFKVWILAHHGGRGGVRPIFRNFWKMLKTTLRVPRNNLKLV